MPAPHFNNLGIDYIYISLPKDCRNFRSAIEHDPNLAIPWNNIGAACLETGDLKQAIQNLGEAIIRDETLEIAYANRGLAYLEAADYQKAWDDFITAVELAPQEPMHHHNLGLVFLELKSPVRPSSASPKP